MGEIPEYYVPQVQLNMFICNVEVADFIEYVPPETMNIVRVYKDNEWLSRNLKVLDAFWTEVEYYRANKNIQTHLKFPKQKRVLDLTSSENSDESVNLGDYSIRD